jgi:hypothetical protein
VVGHFSLEQWLLKLLLHLMSLHYGCSERGQTGWMSSNRHRQSGRRKGQAVEESASCVVHNLDSYPNFTSIRKITLFDGSYCEPD